MWRVGFRIGTKALSNMIFPNLFLKKKIKKRKIKITLSIRTKILFSEMFFLVYGIIVSVFS